MALSTKQRSARYRAKHPARTKAANREGQQRFRDKQAKKPIIIHYNELPDDQGGALADWARDTLKVPPGHRASGERLELPSYLVSFFADALANDCQESLVCVARKNAKSAGVAVLVLSYLVGPLMREGWRCGVASLSREKAHELRALVESIALASGLDGVKFWRRSSPAITAAGGSVDVLSADRNAGAAAGYDLAIIDEIGLMAEKHRPLVNSLRSSVSARGGRFMCLSVHGDSPFVPEILSRRGAPGLAVHHHAAPTDCALDDPKAHALANPTLGIIKSKAYMKAEAARVIATPSDQASFRALDLNQPGSPSREMVCGPDDWKACTVDLHDLPERRGPCFVGVDIGGSSSMTAAAAWFPETSRLELYAAFPSRPDLSERGTADGVGRIYQEAFERGELQVFDGRITPAGDFVRHVAASLAGCEIAGAASDQYRRSEVMQVIEADDLEWIWDWRRMGAGPTGSADVRAFQRSVFSHEIKTAPSLLMGLALKSTILRRDSNGNPALFRGNTGRIDVLSACVLAIGLAAETGDDSGLVVSGRKI